MINHTGFSQTQVDKHECISHSQTPLTPTFQNISLPHSMIPRTILVDTVLQNIGRSSPARAFHRMYHWPPFRPLSHIEHSLIATHIRTWRYNYSMFLFSTHTLEPVHSSHRCILVLLVVSLWTGTDCRWLVHCLLYNSLHVSGYTKIHTRKKPKTSSSSTWV